VTTQHLTPLHIYDIMTIHSYNDEWRCKVAKKVVDRIKRTGRITNPVRYLVAVEGAGKNKKESILSTPIKKIAWALEFRFGAKPAPMEQYAFQVGARTVARFADAAALVLKRHHVEIRESADEMAKYLVKALAILDGDEELQEVELPEGAAPATGYLTNK